MAPLDHSPFGQSPDIHFKPEVPPDAKDHSKGANIFLAIFSTIVIILTLLGIFFVMLPIIICGASPGIVLRFGFIAILVGGVICFALIAGARVLVRLILNKEKK